MTVNESLGRVQAELRAPKDQFNKFGGYSYRSCESILEAVKPLLKDEGLTLTMSDSIGEVGGRVYVTATATVADKDGCSVSVTASAREAETKKGMDAAQITGAASSYARKYALNGLFAIDDAKDADATNRHGRETPSKTPQSRSKATNAGSPDADVAKAKQRLWSALKAFAAESSLDAKKLAEEVFAAEGAEPNSPGWLTAMAAEYEMMTKGER